MFTCFHFLRIRFFKSNFQYSSVYFCISFLFVVVNKAIINTNILDKHSCKFAGNTDIIRVVII